MSVDPHSIVINALLGLVHRPVSRNVTQKRGTQLKPWIIDLLEKSCVEGSIECSKTSTGWYIYFGVILLENKSLTLHQKYQPCTCMKKPTHLLVSCSYLCIQQMKLDCANSPAHKEKLTAPVIMQEEPWQSMI